MPAFTFRWNILLELFLLHFSGFAAFGWCGDISTAFQVVDEMIQDGIMVTTETMSFLLQACITNKEAGFWYAVKVRMRREKVK